jgi:hypothetical protein
MPITIKDELLHSNRKTVAITKLMICISMVMALILVGGAFYFFALTFLSIVIILLALVIVTLLILMIITLKNYEIYESGICLEEINVLWEDIISLQMPFQDMLL